MKRQSYLWVMAAAGILCGCGDGAEAGKVDPAALDAVFQDAPAQPAAEESTTDTVVIGGGADQPIPVKELATRAAAAMRKDDLSEAIMMLQNLRRARGLSGDQLTAVQDQMAAMQSDLANRAAQGDAKAKAALNLIQQSTRW